jgi:hypothetical protein
MFNDPSGAMPHVSRNCSDCYSLPTDSYGQSQSMMNDWGGGGYGSGSQNGGGSQSSGGGGLNASNFQEFLDNTPNDGITTWNSIGDGLFSLKSSIDVSSAESGYDNDGNYGIRYTFSYTAYDGSTSYNSNAAADASPFETRNGEVTTGVGFLKTYGLFDPGRNNENGQLGSNGAYGESPLSTLWNSDFARFLVPDDIGIHISGSIVVWLGGGGSVNFDLLTRGNDAGFHKSISTSIRAGVEIGVGFSLLVGNYQGRGEDVSFSSLYGVGADLNIAVGWANVGVWNSINSKSFNSTWWGTSFGIGLGGGSSVGVDYTIPIK